MFCGEFIKKFNLDQLENFRICCSYVYLGAESLAEFCDVVGLIWWIINLNKGLKYANLKIQKSPTMVEKAYSQP